MGKLITYVLLGLGAQQVFAIGCPPITQVVGNDGKTHSVQSCTFGDDRHGIVETCALRITKATCKDTKGANVEATFFSDYVTTVHLPVNCLPTNPHFGFDDDTKAQMCRFLGEEFLKDPSHVLPLVKDDVESTMQVRDLPLPKGGASN